MFTPKGLHRPNRCNPFRVNTVSAGSPRVRPAELARGDVIGGFGGATLGFDMKPLGVGRASYVPNALKPFGVWLQAVRTWSPFLIPRPITDDGNEEPT